MTDEKLKPVVHCWEDGPWIGGYEDGTGTSCMLEDGHEGPHDFVRNDQIIIRFAGTRTPPEQE